MSGERRRLGVVEQDGVFRIAELGDGEVGLSAADWARRMLDRMTAGEFLEVTR